MMKLPLYLIRDIQNFIKLKDIQKFLWQDMSYFEVIHEYGGPYQIEDFIDEKEDFVSL